VTPADPRDALPIVERPLADRWRRTIRYLRVSVTDRCNYRCAYCMPLEGWAPVERTDLLSLEEIARVVRALAPHGVERVRITGGEPLVRKGVVDLVGWLAETPGISEVAMTTNGHLLERFAAPLWSAGLRTLNVSVDTFDPDRFAAVTRGGDLARVQAGLDAARTAGFEHIRVNAVALRDVNDGERAAAFVERCWAQDLLPRFIELMPVGGLPFQTDRHRVTTSELLQALRERYDLVPEGRPGGTMPRGPAAYWRVEGGASAGRRVGLISPMSDDGFCAACNRARLTARGGLRACLANDDEVSILQAVRAGASDAALVALCRQAVEGKLEAHRMGAADIVPLTIMTGIGG
jgi:cyclic pyranopterin phosphate synthase